MCQPQRILKTDNSLSGKEESEKEFLVPGILSGQDVGSSQQNGI